MGTSVTVFLFFFFYPYEECVSSIAVCFAEEISSEDLRRSLSTYTLLLFRCSEFSLSSLSIYACVCVCFFFLLFEVSFCVSLFFPLFSRSRRFFFFFFLICGFLNVTQICFLNYPSISFFFVVVVGCFFFFALCFDSLLYAFSSTHLPLLCV